jgi:hypothetical protein
MTGITIRRRTIRTQPHGKTLRQEEKDRVNLHINRPQLVTRIQPGTNDPAFRRRTDPSTASGTHSAAHPRHVQRRPHYSATPGRTQHQQSHRTIRPPRP